MSKNAVKNLVT